MAHAEADVRTWQARVNPAWRRLCERGFVTVEDGKHRRACVDARCRGCQQVRHFKAECTKDDAESELAAYLLKIEAKAHAPGLTLAQAAGWYLAAKARKRTLTENRRQLKHLKDAFGAETPLVAITSPPYQRAKNHARNHI